MHALGLFLRSNPARHIRRDFAAQALLRGFQSFDGAIELGARGQQAFAIGEGPAVILHVGGIRRGWRWRIPQARAFRRFDRYWRGESQNSELPRRELAEQFEHAELLCVRLGAGNFVGGFFAGALKAEAAGGRVRRRLIREASFVERHTGRDEIYVQAGGAGGADQFDDVGACERLTAGEVGLQDAGLRGFLKDARPCFGGELVWRDFAVPEGWSSRRSAAGSGGLARRLG